MLPCSDTDTAACSAAAPQVLLVDVEVTLAALFAEWLRADGIMPLGPDAAAQRVDLVVVDLPYPRQSGTQQLQALAAQRPGTPILALSPTFFAGVAGQGGVARQLGVAGVLASPVQRDALLGAVNRLLGRGP